jgi:hypothetical protein
MPSLFENMSAAERKAIANKILDLPYEAQKELVQELGSIVEEVNAAESKIGKRKAFIAKLSAMRADQHVGARNAINLIEGDLRRANCPPLEDLGMKPLHEINSILAAAKIETVKRMAIKNILHRLGAI